MTEIGNQSIDEILDLTSPFSLPKCSPLFLLIKTEALMPFLVKWFNNLMNTCSAPPPPYDGKKKIIFLFSIISTHVFKYCRLFLPIQR